MWERGKVGRVNPGDRVREVRKPVMTPEQFEAVGEVVAVGARWGMIAVIRWLPPFDDLAAMPLRYHVENLEVDRAG